MTTTTTIPARAIPHLPAVVPRYMFRWVFGSTAVLYFAVALWLALDHGYLMGDALSRVSAARAVLFSRDPHAAAIGFVFTPLTAILQLPIVALSDWFPAITRWGIPGSVVSSLGMAGAVTQIFGMATDRGFTTRHALVLTAIFALNPMIVFYGANGMSEALFLCATCWAVRRLVRWIYTDDVHDLITTGIALACGYLVRYDAVVAAAAATVVVAVVTFRRARQGGVDAKAAAVMDVFLVASLPGAAFVVWAATSWLVTGQAFQQFSSLYGNTAILVQSGAEAPGFVAGSTFAVGEIAVLAPAAFVLVPVMLAISWRRRDAAAIVPIVLFGIVLAFQSVSYVSGGTFGFLRFYIVAIALQVALVVIAFPQRRLPPTQRPGRFARTPLDHGPSIRVVPVVLTCSLVVGLVTTAWGMTRPALAPQENALLATIDHDADYATHDYSHRLHTIASFSTERMLAEYIDNLNLPRGSVLVDTLYGFAITVASKRPDVFVVPSDEDFVAVLNHPAENGVQLMLTVANEGRGISDAINRRYPTIYANGAEIGALDIEVPNDGANQPTWRIYRTVGVS